MLSIIVAFDNNQLIGANNALPWHLPADLQYFKSVTMNHTIVMGRKTYESIGRILPKRRNIILTSDPTFSVEGAEVAHSVNELLTLITPNEEAFIIGGSQIYKQFLSIVDSLYITKVIGEFTGDTYFPTINFDEWKLVSEVKGDEDEKNKYPHLFLHYQRATIDS